MLKSLTTRVAAEREAASGTATSLGDIELLRGEAAENSGRRIIYDAGNYSILWTLRPERVLDGGPDVGRALHDVDAGGAERGHLLRRRSLASSDDSAGMTHSAPRRGRLPRYEPNHR